MWFGPLIQNSWLRLWYRYKNIRIGIKNSLTDQWLNEWSVCTEIEDTGLSQTKD